MERQPRRVNKAEKAIINTAIDFMHLFGFGGVGGFLWPAVDRSFLQLGYDLQTEDNNNPSRAVVAGAIAGGIIDGAALLFAIKFGILDHHNPYLAIGSKLATNFFTNRAVSILQGGPLPKGHPYNNPNNLI